MRKNLKKGIASILCLSLLTGMVSFAKEENEYTKIDPYAQNLKEGVLIDGVEYSYEYDLVDGYKSTLITNENTSETELLLYDEEAGVFYLNDEIVATVKDVGVDDVTSTKVIESGLYEQADTRGYTQIGTVNKEITWKTGVAYAVAAGIIAGCLVGMTGAMVIAKIGASSVQAFAKNCVGGRVRSTVYEMKAGSTVSYKHVWSFTTSKGTKYGNYTSYASGQ